jgi:allantoicase
VRELRYSIGGPGFRVREVTLATTLLDAELYTSADLAELYRGRWQVEISRPHYERNDTLYQPGRSAYRSGVGAFGIGTVVPQAA